MPNIFQDKTILVTGGTGSIGSALVEELLKHEPKRLRVLSRDESKQYYLLEHLHHPKNLRLLIGDIRDKERLKAAFEGVDIVFHAAALKHVPLCEYNPFEAVQTNVIGSQNIIDAALANGVKKVIAISTDKAVNPVGIMGTSKLMMEKLMINANYVHGKTQTKFSCVRFGNISWARGSVLNLWKNQIAKNNTLKITEGGMTRFLMSQKQAVELVFEATGLARGGEIFIFKMPSIALKDLAKMFLEKYYPNQKIQMEIIGNRTGEKKHEELLDPTNGNESILENEKMYIITPKLPIYNIEQKIEAYPGFRPLKKLQKISSESYINKKKIAEII